MRKILILLLASTLSLPAFAQSRRAYAPGTQPLLPTENIANNLPIEVYITNVSLSTGMNRLTVTVKLVNKSSQESDFTLGGLSLTVYNSKSKKKESWVSHKIYAKNSAYQRQAGSGGIVLPAQSKAYADIVFNKNVGKYAQEITEGTMSVNINGAYKSLSVPQIKRAESDNSSGAASNSGGPGGPSSTSGGPGGQQAGPNNNGPGGPNGRTSNSGSGGRRPGARPGN